MILETLPSVQQLSQSEQSQLVDELWEHWLPRDDDQTRSATLEVLNARMAHYARNPETASTWEEVKRRIERLRECRQ